MQISSNLEMRRKKQLLNSLNGKTTLERLIGVD